MIEKIAETIYKIEVPLPRSPLKAINSYVIKGHRRNLIVDTGMNRDECFRALQAGLKELEVDVRETDFFITHLHADHVGLVSHIASPSSVIYFNGPDAERLASGIPWEEMKAFALKNGFPENELRAALDNHPGHKYGTETQVPFTIVQEGHVISIGKYTFHCIATPGHTKGHMCLYEPERKIFLAGDHILHDITPHIQLWTDRDNPLKDYLESLDKVYHLDIELVFAGHRVIFNDCKQRIEQLKRHHQVRAEEITILLKNGRKSAYEVASQMTWDINYESWDFSPVLQKWFATGEAIAHLKYLEEQGALQKILCGEHILYSLSQCFSAKL